MDTVGDNETVLGGTVPQRLLSCLQSLDALLTQKEPVVSSFVPAEKESNADRKTSDSLMQTICKVMGEPIKHILDWILVLRTYIDSAHPDRALQNSASDQGVHCLVTAFAAQNTMQFKTFIRNP